MYSLFTLFMLVVFECMMVKRRMGNMKMIRNMRTKPFLIYVKSEFSRNFYVASTLTLCYRFIEATDGN